MRFKLKILIYLIQVKLLKWWFGDNFSSLQQINIKTIKKTISASSFYSKFRTRDFNINDFTLSNKKLFMANFDAINTCNIHLEDALNIALKAEQDRNFAPTLNGITVGLSSGTSGNRGVFLASENERAMWVAMMLDRVIGFSLKQRSIAFFLRANSNLYTSVKSSVLSFNYFDLLEAIPLHVQRLNQLQPNILVAPPSMLMELAKATERGELSIYPAKVISVAEVLTPEDNAHLTTVFQQTIHQVYQCTEGFLASSCKYGTLHFNEDFLIIEKKYIDNDHLRFHPIVTDLKRTSQPIIRYELNDILIEQPTCKCGSKMMAISSIEGRSDDILEFKDSENKIVKIFPDFFRKAIILSHEEICDYALIQTDYTNLNLFIESANDQSLYLAMQSINDLLQSYKVLNINISKLKDKNHIQGSKLRRIRNEIGKTN
jgi:putative adenylate-forming enzyme